MRLLKPFIRTLRRVTCAAALFLGLSTTSANAAGLLTPSDGSLPALQIREHAVDVVIEDGYAITTVDQSFHNPHRRDLEAIYSFPVPERGAVAEFTVWIDGQPVTGEVIEKQRAREIYASEKAAGRTAGVAEKDDYRSFDIRVHPVRAGADTRVRLVYMQPAHIDTGVGRYVYPLAEGGVDENKLAFWTTDEAVRERFSFDLRLRSAYPVDAVRLPKHDSVTPQRDANGDWLVKLEARASQTLDARQANDALDRTINALESGQQIKTSIPVTPSVESANGSAKSPASVFDLNEDIVVYWRHQPGLPGSVDLVAHKAEGDRRGTFMMVLTPGDDLAPITTGADWVFVLDISGSMDGKYATLADGVAQALGKLRENDRVRLVTFNNAAHEITGGWVTATPANVKRLAQAVAAVQPGGGTDLYAGLERGLDQADADRPTGLVLVTDGVANVGETRQRAFLELLAKKDVRLFTFVMGNSANRPMLETLTRASNGFAMSVSNSDDIVGHVLSATSKLTHQALHGVTLDIAGVQTADVTPATIGSIYRGQQIVLFGHYFGSGPADVTLRAKRSGEPVAYATRFDFPASAATNPEVERLWAYANIEDLMEDVRNFGERDDARQAVTDLGIEYGLVTDYTSMLVVEQQRFSELGIERRNEARRAAEQDAAAKRAASPVQSKRVDTAAPMYDRPRAVHSGAGGGGSGAFGPFEVLLGFVLVVVTLASRRRGKAL